MHRWGGRWALNQSINFFGMLLFFGDSIDSAQLCGPHRTGYRVRLVILKNHRHDTFSDGVYINTLILVNENNAASVLFRCIKH